MTNSQSSAPDADRTVQEATKDEEAREAVAPHTAERPPRSDKEAAAEGNQLDPEVAEPEREMGKLGADVRGEGQID